MKAIVWGAAAAALSFVSAQAADMPVTSVNVASLKAIFDAHGIPAEINKNQNGAVYLSATVGNLWMMTAPVDCKDNNQDGACNTVLIQSTAYTLKKAPTLEQLMEFTRTGPKFVTVVEFGGGHMMVREVFDVSAGVGPDYIKTRFKEFLLENAAFESYLLSLTPSEAGTPSGFSASGGVSLGTQSAADTFSLGSQAGGAEIQFGNP